MSASLAPLAWREVARELAVRDTRCIGRRIVYLPTTSSTNDVARELAGQGEAEGTVVVADAQTQGRGRAGKSAWLTPPYTSLAVSVLLRPPLTPVQLPVLAALCGVAACDAIAGVAGVPASLKWPNDLLVHERKAGGILVESSMRGESVDYAIAGIGINVNLPAAALGALPDAATPPTTLLDEAGGPVSREALLLALLHALDGQYAGLVKGELESLWQAYRARLDTLGHAVRVAVGAATVEGVAEDIGSAGELIVRLPDGRRRAFSYGEVTVRAVPRSVPHSAA